MNRSASRYLVACVDLSVVRGQEKIYGTRKSIVATDSWVDRHNNASVAPCTRQEGSRKSPREGITHLYPKACPYVHSTSSKSSHAKHDRFLERIPTPQVDGVKEDSPPPLLEHTPGARRLTQAICASDWPFERYEGSE